MMIFAFSVLFLSGCMNHEFDTENTAKERAEEIFQIKFDPTQDWCTTLSGAVGVKADAPIENIEKVQLFVCINEFDSDGESNWTLKKINEKSCKSGDLVSMVYDIPSNHIGLFAACVSTSGEKYFTQFTNNDELVRFSATRATTRASVYNHELPDNPIIGRSEKSYANKRGYAGFQNDILYSLSDADESLQIMSVSDYDADFSATMRALTFTYLPNGRSYDNLPQIQESGYYNESSYPITTGDDPIVVSPVYKNDGTSNEVVNCDLYYYYFKESDITGDQIQYIKDLPKYKAIQLNRTINGNRMPNDKVIKQDSYALIYWGDDDPIVGETVGNYQFPAGYKIGFMLRSKVSEVKKGELYCDGRLNGDINKHGHFASSKLGEDPRMAWLTVNGRTLLCCESGTDRDYNDVIFEIEGGVYVPIIIPDILSNFFTFCFEDQNYGDYDLNDVVLKGRRIDDEHVEYTVMACGASDNLYIKNINGEIINDGVEVHELFGKKAPEFINTSGDAVDYVVDVVKVNKSFSFLDVNTQPYIYDKTTNYTVKIATIGQDPHAIMIPYDFRWPKERVRINQAYSGFNNWGENKVTSTDWYKYPDVDKVW